MNTLLTIKMALRGLLLNKVRAFLTVLGVIIGVSGIIVIVAVGNGAESLIVNQVQSVGSNLIGILPGGSEEGEPPAALFGIVITTLKNEDVLALKNVAHVVAVSGYNKSVEQIFYRNRKAETTINGVFSTYPLVEDAVISQGRFFNDSDDNGLAKVVVIGHGVKEDLFANEDPIGKQIKIRNNNYRIIGVFAERGAAGFTNNDAQIFIPSRTMQKLVLGVNHLAMARVKVDTAENVDMVLENVKAIIRSRHGIINPKDDDFTAASQAQGLSTLVNITGSIKLFLAAIAGIALIVGGIGIMNVMYIAVTERTREIGLRKALGAKQADILKQFLVEAIVITGVGGVIGVIIGLAVSFLIAFAVQALGYSWDFIVTLESVLYATIIIAGIGLIFGYSPAKRASSFNAIEALRYE
jgi:putative ABC transport system permease protein